MSACFLFSLLVFYARFVAAGSFFPCHGAKGFIHNEVKCTTVKLPHSICSRCPLRQTLSDGSFEQCDRIYDTSSSQCMISLQEYVDINPCDVRRASALEQLKAGDESGRDEMDYFLYSVCEQCCDCVPMGVQTSDYSQLSQGHSRSSPSLWSETRGNCPAHARYDVCKIFPSIKSFGSFSNEVAICDQLTEWIQSDASEEWQTNPNARVSDDIQKFLRDILVAIHCDNRSIWSKCQVMEDKQNHLEIPAAFATENAPVSDMSAQPSPAITLEDAETVPSSPGSVADTPNDDSENGNGGDDVNLSNETIIASVQTPSETASEESSGNSGSASTSAAGVSSPDSVAGTGENDISDGSGSHKLPILQGIRSCFPGSSTVRRRDGVVLRMEELHVGDEILVSNSKYSPIYTFSHRSQDVYSEFVQIRTTNHSLYLSNEHKLYVNGKMVPAGLVKTGEYVQGQFGVERVVQVTKNWRWGLYNPHTVDGKIVVDGILCTCFTDAVSFATAQGLLSPFRGAFMLGAKDWMLGWWLRDGFESFLFWKGRF
ncbi:hypothetical protein FGB62_199g03 [Gracilaria domingensis]|nr:hypothetical protein FGB62_199g03 [Gracilaria domingensis]